MDTLDIQEYKDKIRVFIVDDSPLVRRSLEGIISADPILEVADTAADGREALDKMSNVDWDVCTLDWQMPGMNGLTVLKHIMIRYLKPTLMLSSFTTEGARITFDALRYGAVDFLQKPGGDSGQSLVEHRELLRSRIKRAAKVQVNISKYLRLKYLTSKKDKSKDAIENRKLDRGIILIFAATGGYASLLSILPSLSSIPQVPIIVMMSCAQRPLDAFVSYLSDFVLPPVKRLASEEKGVLKKGTIYFTGIGDRLYLSMDNDAGISFSLVHKEMSFELFDVVFDKESRWNKNFSTIILSSGQEEGMNGIKKISKIGGHFIVQEPCTCLEPSLSKYVLENFNAQPKTPLELIEFIGSWMPEDKD